MMRLNKSDSRKEDLSLVRECCKGKKRSYDKIVLRYQKQIYQIALGFAHNHQDADEITQDTFVNAYIHIHQYNEKGTFFSWLYRICVNTAINFLKKRDKMAVMFTEIFSNQFYDPGTKGNPYRDLKAKELTELVKKILETIPQDMQTVFVMRTFGELSYKDIAETLNISIGTVMSRLSRVRKHLQVQLRPILNITEKK